MNSLRGAWGIITDHRRPYFVLNAAYYGLVVLGMTYVAVVDPALQEQLLSAVEGAFAEGPLAAVGGAYLGGNVIAAAVLTFVFNLSVGSLLTITLPSLIVPFSGLLLGAYRAALWGLILAPTNTELALVMIPHSLTLLLEGQAYILAMLAVYVQGKAFLWPDSVGAANRSQGYVTGLKLSARLYLLVLFVLALAAVYEALEVTIMARLASGAI
ncbi:MAG: stage II sporulation protein M [Anaerolineae bacterium]|nr:stage II sporulation protein M [Anaerolineae bacterium]NIN98701.1 stage II sporulation protein M [Anaerolineae bacterium]NIQ81591.1 stage II sporulation protein M [Anaerolineae bacterium]